MPSLYNDNFLSINSIVVQQKSGTSWKKATAYQMGGQYRVRMLFKNNSSSSIPTGGSAFGHCDIYISSITLDLEITGAKFLNNFNEDISNKVRLWLMDMDDFNDNIPPAKARYFNVEFTWNPAVTLPVKAVPITISTYHRENMHIQPGSKANFNLNQ